MTPALPRARSDQPSRDDQRIIRSYFAQIVIVAALALVTARLINTPQLASANDRSRWSTVWSLVHRDTYQIDEIRQRPGWESIDTVRHDGHFYSSKPPLLPRAVAEVYRGVRRATGWSLTTRPDETAKLILFLVNIVPWGLALAAFWMMIPRYCADPLGQRFLLVAAAVATMLTPYLTVFNNHTPAATFLVFALAPALRILCDNRQEMWRYVACGLATGVVVVNELPAAAFAAALFLPLWKSSPRKACMGYLPGVAVFVAALLATNYQVTGGWKPFYAEYGTETYNFVHEGVPSYWQQPVGIDRPRDSFPEYLLHCTLGHHGFLSLSPIFLLTLAAWCRRDLWNHTRLKGLWWLAPTVSLVVFAFYLSRTSNYNYSGHTLALRWMLWLVPLWLLSLIPAFESWGNRRSFRWVALACLGASTFSAWTPLSPWSQNWIYTVLERNGWIDYSDPPLSLHRRHTSWIGQLPEGELQPEYTITFSSLGTDGSREELRLSDGGPREDRRIVEVRHSRDGAVIAETSYLLDPAAFMAGEPASKFLVGRVDETPLGEADFEFFRGLPGPASVRPEYRVSPSTVRYRYLKTPLREDAFECLPVIDSVVVPSGESSRQFVRDVWLCEELPFGVLRWVDRLLDRTGRQVGRREWEPTAVGTIAQRGTSGNGP